MAAAIFLESRVFHTILEKPHGTILVVMVHRTVGRIDRQGFVVGADAVTVGIGIGENPCLEHFNGAEANTRHHVGRAERGRSGNQGKRCTSNRNRAL